MLGDVLLRCRRIAAETAGNIIIEFALALPVLFLLAVGLLDLGRFAMQKSALAQGAEAGAQYAIVAPSDSANINSTAQSATGLTGVTATNSVFCECVSGTAVTCGSTCSGGAIQKKYVTVTTTKAFSSVLSVTTFSVGGFASWTPPTSASASVTMILP